LSRPRIRTLLAPILAAATLIAVPGPTGTAAADPIFIDWPSLVPGLIDTYIPNSDNLCVAGRPACIDAEIAEMRTRFGTLGMACSHQAVFALAYLRTTQTFKWSQQQPGYYSDRAFVTHEGAVFAKYYLQAYDRWAAGNRAAVPQAWLTALDAAQQKRVTGTGNLLLGMNAHINRDLPFVLAAIGLTTPEGDGRKPDHNKVNQFLSLVTEPMMAEEIARLDPSMINLSTPYGIGYTGLFQLIAVWRETAWRNAELLVAAPTDAARAVVAAQIELTAALEATALVAANLYVPLMPTPAARDAHCAAHNGAAPTMPYPFGTPSAY
jgi:hypothetical protein